MNDRPTKVDGYVRHCKFVRRICDLSATTSLYPNTNLNQLTFLQLQDIIILHRSFESKKPKENNKLVVKSTHFVLK